MPTKAHMAAKRSYENAQTLVKLNDDPKSRNTEKSHPILDGVSGQTGDHIMAIVAMRIDGNSDTKIGDLIDIAQPNISRMETNYPEAFAAAKSHHLHRAAENYEITLWGVRAAMTKHGIEAVDTLAELMVDPDTPHHIRRACAVDILNLSGAGYTRKTVGGRDTRIHVGEINNIAAGLDDKYLNKGPIVDAEIVEENS
jgi:hypothetical protein